MAISIMLEIWEEFETDYERNIVMEKLKQGFTISVLYIGIVYAIFVGSSCHPAVKYKVMNLIFVNKTIERETFLPVYFTKYVQENYYFVLFATVMGSVFLGAILGTLNYLQYTLTKFVIALFIIIRLLTILQLCTHQKYLIIIITIIIDLSLTGFVFLYFISFDKMYALETILWFVVSVLSLFYIIYPGQELMNANNKLREACCSCKWHMFRAKERKLILLMMIRSSKPYVLTAGPTIPMSYETSTHILRHVVSYLMALYQISRDFK
uniref:Uncharacterized protein n=1 Tax=Trichogramma kaykai TaxID=54128 RepID=A0ABD2WHW8_9HYME